MTSASGGGKLLGGVAWGVGGAAGQALFQLLITSANVAAPANPVPPA